MTTTKSLFPSVSRLTTGKGLEAVVLNHRFGLSEYKMSEDTESYVAGELAKKRPADLHVFVGLPSLIDRPDNAYTDSRIEVNESRSRRSKIPAQEMAAAEARHAGTIKRLSQEDGDKAITAIQALVKKHGVEVTKQPVLRKGEHHPVHFVHLVVRATGPQVKALAAHESVVELSQHDLEDLRSDVVALDPERKGKGQRLSFANMFRSKLEL